ncbi:MAG TPA: ABC transporter permease [Lachnospiraceae bacterium]|nr:ABC transporter permease [Lachnospiraceae bacterium]
MESWLNILSGMEWNDEVKNIVLLTIKLAFCSTFISTILGVLLGLLLEQAEFPGKRVVVRINRTLMGIPPVVVGLLVYLMLMRRGLLGEWGILFTFQAMVIAQMIIITPIVCGMVYQTASRTAPQIRNFAKSMGASRWQTFCLLIKELRNDLYFVFVAGFGRSVSEVGAVMIVGGNIQYKTRTMTTAISLMRNKGDYGEAITMGVLLLAISFTIQWLADFLRREEKSDEND